MSRTIEDAKERIISIVGEHGVETAYSWGLIENTIRYAIHLELRKIAKDYSVSSTDYFKHSDVAKDLRGRAEKIACGV